MPHRLEWIENWPWKKMKNWPWKQTSQSLILYCLQPTQPYHYLGHSVDSASQPTFIIALWLTENTKMTATIKKWKWRSPRRNESFRVSSIPWFILNIVTSRSPAQGQWVTRYFNHLECLATETSNQPKSCLLSLWKFWLDFFFTRIQLFCLLLTSSSKYKSDLFGTDAQV